MLYTAADARMHDYATVVPRDCVATQTDERNRRALCHFEEVLCLPTPLSIDLEVPGGPLSPRGDGQALRDAETALGLADLERIPNP